MNASESVVDPITGTPSASGTEILVLTQPGGHPMEVHISRVLRIGVLIAATIIFVGLVLSFADAGSTTASRHQLTAMLHGSSQSIPVSPTSIWHGVTSGDPIAIIQLGVLALILTPMTRVAMTAGLFLAQRDRIFVDHHHDRLSGVGTRPHRSRIVMRGGSYRSAAEFNCRLTAG